MPARTPPTVHTQNSVHKRKRPFSPTGQTRREGPSVHLIVHWHQSVPFTLVPNGTSAGRNGLPERHSLAPGLAHDWAEGAVGAQGRVEGDGVELAQVNHVVSEDGLVGLLGNIAVQLRGTSLHQPGVVLTLVKNVGYVDLLAFDAVQSKIAL